ncbi:MAG: cell wall metabolism sensor histidine kinase WalK [Clostridia bacterium]|nr:cell wall metabolism sensor histidine kinase WalK [Clostridia bacterium]
MKRKIFLYCIVLVIIGLSVTGFFTSKLAQYFYKHEVEEKLKNTATLIEYQVSSEISNNIKIDYNKIARDYGAILNKLSIGDIPPKDTSTRITFIDFKGNVLGESEYNYREMENHLDRKEVQQAVRGKIGKDVRSSKTLGLDFLYIAVPLQNSDIIVRISVPLLQLNAIDKAIWYYSIIGILSGLFLTILLALRVSWTLTKPIEELIIVSKEISKGNYQKRVKIRSRDELGQLGDTFNKMAAKLDETIAEMLDKNIKVDSIINSMTSGIIAVDTKFRIILINSIACELFGIKDGPGIIGINLLELIRNNQINILLKDTIEKNISIVSELVIDPPRDKVLRIYTNPIKSKSALTINAGGIIAIQDITNIRKLEQIRTEFVSNVTHELKTPLTSIRGFIETLRSGALNDKNVADKFLEIIDIEAERLYMLINDILQLSEIESKQKDSNISSHRLKSIVDETLSILENVAHKKDVRLESDVDASITLMVNKDRIKQMLINLIDNGIKYNVENGLVSIKAYKSDGKVIISVKDTGIGIADEHLPRIFERFYRVDKGRSRSMGGTGLGLSIVKHIANLYNGDIRIYSAPGQGTEFVIQLPM